MLSLDNRPSVTDFPASLVATTAPRALSGAAFHEFLENWKPGDERAPNRLLSSKLESSTTVLRHEANPETIAALQTFASPAVPATAITEGLMDAQNGLPAVSITTPVRLSRADQVGLLAMSNAGSAELLSAQSAAALEPTVTDHQFAGRFSWGKTAMSALWSADGIAVTIRDFSMTDTDAVEVLRAVETTLGSEGLALKRLIINGKCVWDSSSRR